MSLTEEQKPRDRFTELKYKKDYQVVYHGAKAKKARFTMKMGGSLLTSVELC